MKWVLIPGLGVDHRYFANIIDLLGDYQVLKFETPGDGETIEHYAERLRRQIHADPGAPQIVLGGVSFGGMLASIMCQQVNPVALVLMSSTTRPEALRGSVRAFEWLSRIWPETFAKWLYGLGGRTLGWLDPVPPQQVEHFQEIVRDADIQHTRACGRMIMGWRQAPPITCPLFHLHGSRDLLLPVHKVQPTHVVEGAGHIMNLTHPHELRAFIQEVHERLSANNA